MNCWEHTTLVASKFFHVAVLAGFVSLGGCQQTELRGVERGLDRLGEHPGFGLAVAAGSVSSRDAESDNPLSLKQLLVFAELRAAQVLRAQLSTYEADLKVNEVSSKVLPRVDLRPGYEQSIFQPKNSSAEGFNVPLIVDWNLLSYWQRQRELLVYLQGREASLLALKLAKNEAKAATVGLYFQLWILRQSLAGARLQMLHAGRLVDDAKFLHVRGSISDARLREVEREWSKWHDAVEANAYRVRQSERRLQEFLALPRTANFAPPLDDELQPPMRPVDPEICAEKSESAVIGALRVQMADDAAEVAKFARWTQFGSTVSALGLSGNAAGLIGASVFWLLPLLDRNEQQRTVLAARIQSVNARIGRTEAVAQFQQMIADLIQQISEKEIQVSSTAGLVAEEETRLKLAGERNSDGKTSKRDVEQQQLRLAEKEAMFISAGYELAASKLKLGIMCADVTAGGT